MTKNPAIDFVRGEDSTTECAAVALIGSSPG
jgi:hypothetical protein